MKRMRILKYFRLLLCSLSFLLFCGVTVQAKDILEEDADGSVHQHPVAIQWGYNTPGWKVAKWAPTSVTWVPRQVWIIEQIPKDPYYN